VKQFPNDAYPKMLRPLIPVVRLDYALRQIIIRTQINALVRGAGFPHEFTGKNMPLICLMVVSLI